MSILHIANTDFEFELSQPSQLSSNDTIEQSWHRHPLCLQLQYLPLLYSRGEEGIVVTQQPPSSFLDDFQQQSWRQCTPLPQFVTLKQRQLPSAYTQCVSWGASKRVEQWAKDRHIAYEIPKWEVVQEINSKAFSYTHAPALPGSSLIYKPIELNEWLKSGQGLRVLKTCFGLSGRGHFFVDEKTDATRLLKFCEKEWSVGLPLIAEPWLKRVLDFSTQWHIDQKNGVQFIGATVFEVDEKGSYQATRAGPANQLFTSHQHFLDEHCHIARKLIEDVMRKGFFGYMGIDAFIYCDEKSRTLLHPVVEINGRQTMSLAALRFQQNWFPNQIVRLFFADSRLNYSWLLPNQIVNQNQKITCFQRRLTFSIIK